MGSSVKVCVCVCVEVSLCGDKCAFVSGCGGFFSEGEKCVCEVRIGGGKCACVSVCAGFFF